MEKLTRDDVAKWNDAKRQLQNLEAVIVDRVDYIIQTIHKTFGAKYDSWYFEGAGEGEIGTIPHLDDASMWTIELHGSRLSEQDATIILSGGRNWDLQSCHFPTSWLFEDFEVELIEGKLLHKEKQEQKRQEISRKREEEKSLAASAQAKLTKAELAALRKSLR